MPKAGGLRIYQSLLLGVEARNAIRARLVFDACRIFDHGSPPMFGDE
jgi:hypothetical protein